MEAAFKEALHRSHMNKDPMLEDPTRIEESDQAEDRLAVSSATTWKQTRNNPSSGSSADSPAGPPRPPHGGHGDEH